MYGIFYRIALGLYKGACIHKIPFPSNRQVERDLERLYPGENQKKICTEYYVKKLAKSLMISLVAIIFGVILGVQSKGEAILNEAGEIVRGGYEDEAKEIEIECALPDGKQNFQIEVGSRIYGEEEIFQLYDSFYRELPDYILGENISLEEITGNLLLKDCYEGYPFTVEWESTNPDIVGKDGTVVREETERKTELLATITYREWEWEHSFIVQVAAMSLTEEEMIHREIGKLLQEAELNSRTEETWKLPESWQGQELRWKEKIKNYGLSVAIVGLAVSVLIYLLADKDLHDNVEKRKQLMKKDFPDVVHKLTLYLGAGMTIRGSFQKMAEEGKKSPVYEEILHTCRELKAGVSEGAAYEHFGRRTGLQEYIRLSTLLTQNLKKGNSTLLQRLREEVEKASNERIQYSKRLGEEAVTKLLLPMVLMLLVVMLMIMIPAFSSMGA